MTIEEIIDRMKQQECPRKVNVVDAVMEEINQHPYMRRRGSVVRHWASVAAVVVVAVLGITLFTNRNHGISCSDSEMGSMIARLNDYSSWSPIEEAAVDPSDYDYLYGEETSDSL